MFERYAIYYTAQGAFASRGAAWLGWDLEQGQSVPHSVLEGIDLSSLTTAPRKYGFHATLKPPFRLANGQQEADLLTATKALAQQLSTVSLEGLEVATLGRFLALVPTGDTTALRETAAKVVSSLDEFRAPLTAEELARRRTSNLNEAHEQNLRQWGYPHVMDQFRFHMTLTNRLPRADIPQVQSIAASYFAPVLPQPFKLDALTLLGQRPDGMFVTIERVPLT